MCNHGWIILYQFTINILLFFHDNFNLDLNPLFSSELRIEAAASFNSQLLSHVFVRGCWKHQLLFCCRYCLPAMLPLVLIQLRSRVLGSIIIKDLTLELTRLCILIERVIKMQSWCRIKMVFNKEGTDTWRTSSELQPSSNNPALPRFHEFVSVFKILWWWWEVK